jgi:hypothetical protein
MGRRGGAGLALAAFAVEAAVLACHSWVWPAFERNVAKAVESVGLAAVAGVEIALQGRMSFFPLLCVEHHIYLTGLYQIAES